jgi:hypothetical protein
MLDPRFLSFGSGFVKDDHANILVSLLVERAPSTDLLLLVTRSYSDKASRSAAGAFFNTQLRVDGEGCTIETQIEENRVISAFTLTARIRPTEEGAVRVLGTPYARWAPFAPGEGSMCRTRGGLRVTDLQGNKAEIMPLPDGSHEIVEVRSARQETIQRALVCVEAQYSQAFDACVQLLMVEGLPMEEAFSFLTDAEAPSFNMATLALRYDCIPGFTDALRELRRVNRQMLDLILA